MLGREREIRLAGDIALPPPSVENLSETNKIPPKEMIAVNAFDCISKLQIPFDRRNIFN